MDVEKVTIVRFNGILFRWVTIVTNQLDLEKGNDKRYFVVKRMNVQVSRGIQMESTYREESTILKYSPLCIYERFCECLSIRSFQGAKWPVLF